MAHASMIALLWSFVAIWGLANADFCVWEATAQNSLYTFDLAGPANKYEHGIRSEDGFYKVASKDADGDVTTLFFQFCEHMKFNHDPPMCQRCESCGGPDHCGETCSALQQVSYPGYSLCTTLGIPSRAAYSLLDSQKPETGILVKMSSNSTQAACSLSVSLYCKHDGVELPTSATRDSSEGCHYETSMKHPAACPSVTRLSKGGLGWFSTLLVVLLCLFLVYMVAATIYRRKALGIVGTEAIPHMEFWTAIPSNVQLGVEYVIAGVTGLYRRFTERSYIRVNE